MQTNTIVALACAVRKALDMGKLRYHKSKEEQCVLTAVLLIEGNEDTAAC